MIVMRKKYEFQPDKPRASLLTHLILTQAQQKTLWKWFLYGFVLLSLSVLQDVLLSQFRLMGATTELVPCAIFLISILEGSYSGSLFSLIASLLYLFTGTAPGPYAMVSITFLSILVSIFRQAYLHPGFLAALLCTAVAMTMYELVNFAFGIFLGLTILQRIHGFLVTAGLSVLAVPILYPLTKAIRAIGGSSWKE